MSRTVTRACKTALLLALISGMTAASDSAAVRKSDENGDGEVDRWVEVVDENTTRVLTDRNSDGIPDYELQYDRRGRKILERLDFNYDEVMDDFSYYRLGVLVRREIDTDFDEQIDLWVYLYEGVYIDRVERDRDGDGEIDYVKDYGLADDE